MEDLRATRAAKPEKKENNTIKRKLEILDGAAASGKELTEFCQDFNRTNPNNPLDTSFFVVCFWESVMVVFGGERKV